ncbi:flavin-containing monooxygenase [Cupriavidus necator]|nr:NAD(P)/FAD-dependent oxidoreductase [Cupriavidus necator]WKA43269.1 NAD(P)-binding domain-containing protein [Cupriavidus necator]CAJ96528.1 Monooxygenase [Cupriavidus necator H16]
MYIEPSNAAIPSAAGTNPLAARSELRDVFTNIARQRQIAESDLRKYLADVDPALLLASLVHITRDPSLLSRYAPELKMPDKGDLMPGVKVVETLKGFAQVATIPGAIRQEMIELTVAALDKPASEQTEYLSGYDLAPDLFLKMAAMVTGEPIDAEFGDMLLEQAGFVRNQPVLPQRGRPTERIELAIIGAGMSGIAAAIQAKDRGFRYRIFDSNNKVGGVWAANDYPGVAVDTPATYYSLSYELNPSWSNYYPVGSEYLRYLEGIVEKHNISEFIELESEILKIQWIEEDQEWELMVVKKGREASRVRATAVMSCLGHLNRPNYPDLQGRETFKGVSIHANRWKHDVDLRGKRVGIIGTGATGVQVIGKISQEVDHLTVFMRQPMWIIPNQAGDGDIPQSKRWARQYLPYFLHWDRLKSYWTYSDKVGYPIVRADPEWAKTHVSISPANDRLMQFCINYINSCFGEGSELARKLTPDYAPLGKRSVRDPYDFAPGGFYYALSQPNVALETSKLARVVPDGILTVDGKLIELDVIIYATGLTLDWLSPIEVAGRNGVRLSDVWRDNNPSSYLGGMVPKFPNLFINSGPHTGAGHAGGHNFMAEVVNHYAMECLQLLVEEDARSLEVTQEAFDEHNRKLDEKMAGAIWAWERRAHTYYTNQKGRPILPTPWRHVDFWRMTREPMKEAFILR